MLSAFLVAMIRRAAGFLKDQDLLNPTPPWHRVERNLARQQAKSAAFEKFQHLGSGHRKRRPACVRAEWKRQVDIDPARFQQAGYEVGVFSAPTGVDCA